MNDKLAVIRQQLESEIAFIIELGKEGKFEESYKYSVLTTEAIHFYRRYWRADLTDLYPALIAAQPVHQLTMSIIARQLSDAGMHDAAALVAGTVASYNIPGNAFPLFHAEALRKAGEISAARAVAENYLASHPDDGDMKSELTQCDLEGSFLPIDYYNVLHAIHTRLSPESYLEIGVAQGRSLALARKESVAIGVDPDTGDKEKIFFHSPNNEPHLFRLTSDDFFATCSLPELMGKPTVDVAFLDGLHLFEQTLRDFMNVERFASRDTVVLIHDCLPVNKLVAERERKTAFWLGDVWKIIPCLKSIRPDLDIATLPVQPSGLAVVRNLNPSSRVLERQFDAIVQHFMEAALPESWEDICKLCCVTDQSPEQLFGIR